jgi:uncharacterized membrane protein
MSTRLVVHVIHIVCAALWVGAAAVSAIVLMPALRELGAEGGKFAAAIERRKFGMLVGIIAFVTVVTGFWLYYLYTGGFSPEVSRSHAGMAYGTGGLFGLIALIIGGGVLSRSLAKAHAIAAQAANLPAGADRAPLLAEAARLRHRAETAGRIVAVLVVIAATLMAAALYL